jgi:hypothetical protein
LDWQHGDTEKLRDSYIKEDYRDPICSFLADFIKIQNSKGFADSHLLFMKNAAIKFMEFLYLWRPVNTSFDKSINFSGS